MSAEMLDHYWRKAENARLDGYYHRAAEYEEKYKTAIKQILGSENEKLVLQNRRIDYADYLSSAHWQKMRLQVIARARGECELCGSCERLEGHHLRYSLWREKLSDVVCLCHECHRDQHPQ